MLDADLILFVLGFIFLIKGADFLTDGACSVAEKLRVSDLAIGLTIVSFGTTLPEFVVSIIANGRGNGGIAIGNILGSNIANILLVLGVSAIISPIIIRRKTVWVEIPLSFMAVFLLGVLVNDNLLYGVASSGLTKSDGVILLSCFTIFMVYVSTIPTQNSKNEQHELKQIKTWPVVLMIFGGSVAIFLGGKWVVDGAVHLARILGMRESVIGLTVVAMGTSLPELATCAIASYKKKSDISMGNVLGSNILNIFWVLGGSSIIQPISVQKGVNSDLVFTMLVSLLLFLIMFIGKSKVLNRRKGALFLLIYGSYMTFAFMR